MTDDELQELQRLCDAATPGPWVFQPGGLDNVVWVDAFTFWSGHDEGYLAYLFSPTGVWLLKSLKPRWR